MKKKTLVLYGIILLKFILQYTLISLGFYFCSSCHFLDFVHHSSAGRWCILGAFFPGSFWRLHHLSCMENGRRNGRQFVCTSSRFIGCFTLGYPADQYFVSTQFPGCLFLDTALLYPYSLHQYQ